MEIKDNESDEVKDLRGKILSEIKIDEIEIEEETKENDKNKENEKSISISDSEESWEEENSDESD